MLTVMELLETDSYYILNKNQDSLWFSKQNGSMERKTCWDLASAGDPKCHGLVYGLLGKVQITADASPRLGLITKIKALGNLSGKDNTPVYCIEKVIFLSLTSSQDQELDLKSCHKHQNSAQTERKNILPFGDFQQKVGLSKTFGTIRNVTSTIKSATVNAAANATGQNKARKELKDKEKYEKRILDELLKMFNGSNSFYFSDSVDLTSSLQRQHDEMYISDQPLWQRADDRFFWNRNMLDEFIDKEVSIVPDSWLLPVIQGYIQIESNPLSLSDIGNLRGSDSAKPEEYRSSLIIISRRSRLRAGTRYKRRGVDEDGNVANYVETEQMLIFANHSVSFVQVRGSVPLFWSQPGFKYRPPPKLDKGFDDCASAFKKHMDQEVEQYHSVACLSLVEQNGKEKVIADTYLDHVFHLDHKDVSFISFDFHEYCRGMRYENVSVLLEGLQDHMTKMLYCWVDKQGIICKQRSVFRVNCIDCLDRTNIVQTAIARLALENQFAKLGVIVPDDLLPERCKLILQTMWANNGDTLSKQYAGTSALKGDFTRTGERNFTGLMKDGVNSANRYYLNRFKDAYRQATIDTMLGNAITEDLLSLNAEMTEEDEASLALHVKHVIDDSKILLVPDAETIVSAWGLIDADPVNGDPEQSDMDTILLLTRDSYYIAEYDEVADRIQRFERISLIDLDKVEIGHYTFQGMFKQSRTHLCLRLNYQVEGKAGYFHMLRSMNVRFFNNMAVSIKTDEEIAESIKSIGNTIEMAGQMIGCDIVLFFGKLEKKKSKTQEYVNPLNYLNPITSFTRRSPDSLKSVGTKAFNNVTSGLAKLNPITSLRSRKVVAEEKDIPCPLNYQLQPVVSVSAVPYETGSDQLLMSCGILASSTRPIPMRGASVNAPPLARSHSFAGHTDLSAERMLSGLLLNRSATPEIMISREFMEASEEAMSQRVRNLSHSSNEVDPRDSNDKVGLPKASSVSGLDLKLEAKQSPVSPLSPLASLNRDSVLAPFTVLARGVQSLAPNAGRFARGVQNLGVSFDPRKLKEQRRLKFEEDSSLQERKLKCQSAIIQF